MAKKDKAVQVKPEQTKGTFRAIGIVNRMDDGGYDEKTFDKGKNEGLSYRTLRFGVKTSENNELFVELFGMERDVYAYKPPSKEDKKKNPKAKGVTKKLSFENRDNIPEGYRLIGIKVGTFEDDEAEKKKVITEDYVDYDAIDEIFNEFEDGESISVSGDLSFREYENQQGTIVQQIVYSIKYASKLAKDVDFDDEKFEETSSFEQEIVFVGSAFDKKTQKMKVIGRTISYDGSWFDFPFIIDTSKPEVADIAKAFTKLKFGSLIKVMGLCVNRTETVEVEDDDKKKKASSGSIFGNAGLVPKGQEKRSQTTRVTQLEIIGVDPETFVPEKYKVEDFVEETELVDNEEEENENPFATDSDEDEDNDNDFDDDDEEDDDDDDDMPFN